MKLSRRDLLIGGAGAMAGLVLSSGAVEVVGRRIHLDAELSLDSPAGARAGGDKIFCLHFV